MIPSRAIGVLLATALSLPAWAAKQAKPEPIIASPADFGGYALSFPSEVDRAMAVFTERRAELTALTERFAADKNAIKDPRALALVPALVEAADESGKSYFYVEQARQVAGIDAFLDTEGNDVSRRIATANEHTAKESSCAVDLYSSTSGALRSGVGKQQMEQTRASNEAFLLIERYRGPLTRADVTALMKLADDVARASYLVNIALVEQKVRLRRLVAEADKVARTLQGVVEDEAAYQAIEGQTDGEKKSSMARAEAATTAAGKVDASVAVVADADRDLALDDAIATAHDEYESAIDSLGG